MPKNGEKVTVLVNRKLTEPQAVERAKKLLTELDRENAAWFKKQSVRS